MIKVDIDSHSGFCGGVIRAIGRAEEMLGRGVKLYSLGAIVHNEEELSRLESRGLVTIGKEELDNGAVGASDMVLIRAHGEPPKVYDRLASLGCEVVDCTCPVVLKLQKSIRAAYERLKALPEPGKVVIFGKIGHPEVLGLVGQVDSDAVVVENPQQLSRAIEDGVIHEGCPVELFSQTTMSPEGYSTIRSMLSETLGPSLLEVHDTICSQVASRHRELSEFAASHDVVIFVSGSSSSNGKVLSNLCRSVNPDTYDVRSSAELRSEWFPEGKSVGVSGATSTPKWLLEQVAESIQNLH